MLSSQHSLSHHRHPFPYTHLRYKGAGHLIGIPYSFPYLPPGDRIASQWTPCAGIWRKPTRKCIRGCRFLDADARLPRREPQQAQLSTRRPFHLPAVVSSGKVNCSANGIFRGLRLTYSSHCSANNHSLSSSCYRSSCGERKWVSRTARGFISSVLPCYHPFQSHTGRR